MEVWNACTTQYWCKSTRSARILEIDQTFLLSLCQMWAKGEEALEIDMGIKMKGITWSVLKDKCPCFTVKSKKYEGVKSVETDSYEIISWLDNKLCAPFHIENPLQCLARRQHETHLGCSFRHSRFAYFAPWYFHTGLEKTVSRHSCFTKTSKSYQVTTSTENRWPSVLQQQWWHSMLTVLWWCTV